MTQRHGCVLTASSEQQTDRASDRHTTADDSDAGTVDRDVVAPQQVNHAARRARERRLLAEDESSEVDRVQTVGVLGGIDPLERGVLVEMPWQRELHDVAGAAGVCVELVDGRVEVFGGGVRG